MEQSHIILLIDKVCLQTHFSKQFLFSRDKQDFLFFLVNCPLQKTRFLISAVEWELCDGLPPHGIIIYSNNPQKLFLKSMIFFLKSPQVLVKKIHTFCLLLYFMYNIFEGNISFSFHISLNRYLFLFIFLITDKHEEVFNLRNT